jgi:hypothetical protein
VHNSEWWSLAEAVERAGIDPDKAKWTICSELVKRRIKARILFRPPPPEGTEPQWTQNVEFKEDTEPRDFDWDESFPRKPIRLRWFNDDRPYFAITTIRIELAAADIARLFKSQLKRGPKTHKLEDVTDTLLAELTDGEITPQTREKVVGQRHPKIPRTTIRRAWERALSKFKSGQT